MEIDIEFDKDLTVIAREGYTILDYLSDIGGMQGLLISTAALWLTFWNYNYFDNFMVSRLFRLEKPGLD